MTDDCLVMMMMSYVTEPRSTNSGCEDQDQVGALVVLMRRVGLAKLVGKSLSLERQRGLE